jgi:hypothetical protein
MENTFDVLMEGTMIGAQVDAVLMEADEPSPGSDAKMKDAAHKVITGISGAIAKIDAAKITDLSSKLKGVKLPKVGEVKNPEDGDKKLKFALDAENKAGLAAIKILENAKVTGDAEKAAVKGAIKEIRSAMTIMGKIRAYLVKAWATVKKISKAVVGLEMNDSNWKTVGINVGIIVGAYSVGYGILKTIQGVSADSFFALKTNIKKMYKAVVSSKLTVKTGALAVLFLTAFSGISRLATQAVRAIKAMFNKSGQASE